LVCGADLVARDDQYARIEHWGSGSFGKVYLGKNVITGEEVALKVLPKSVVMDCPVESIREIK
jgi:serine/threonine protein kinase